MNKISCDVCLDLLPLVKDGVASEDSKELVLNHIRDCEYCSAIYSSQEEIDNILDDTLVKKKIRNNLLFFVITVTLFGISLGIMITNSMNMFYNALIMPAIGGFGYLFLRKKAYYAPLAVFLFSLLWHLFDNISDGIFEIGELIISNLFMSGIYTFFSFIGLIIAWTLCYAFRREN